MKTLFALLIAIALALASSADAVTATPVFVQAPQAQQVEIISAVAQCTASGQPFACCTGAGTGTSCNVTAASTDAAPTWTTVFTGSATGPGSKIVGLFLTSTDATAHVVTCVISRTGTTPVTRAGGVAMSTGTTLPGYAASVTAINLMVSWTGLPVDSDGNPYLILPTSSDKLDCRFTTAITSGKLLGLTAIGADF